MKLFRTVVDSTGVKVYGEGEWKTKVHGVSKRRTWRKLHLGVNEATGEIVSGVVTTNDVSDSSRGDKPVESYIYNGICLQELRNNSIKRKSLLDWEGGVVRAQSAHTTPPNWVE